MRANEFLKEDEPVKIKFGNNDAAKAWIEKVYTKYPHTMQNNHVMVWGEGDDQQFAMFELTPSFSKRGAVEVKWIQAYPLRQGVGSRAMQELQSLAKEDGISLTLFPWDKGRVSQAKLIEFYKSQGFKPTVKGGKNMSWDPELSEAELDSTGWGATPQGTDVDYFGLRVKMRPSTFLKLSHPLGSSETNPDVEKHMHSGGKIAYPFLEIKDPVEWEDGDFGQPAKVANHEGRNRMTQWIKLKGDDPIQVNIFLRSANRRRYITDDMIQALSQGLVSQSGQLIKNPFDASTALEETRWNGSALYRHLVELEDDIDEGVVDWAKKGAVAGAIALGAMGSGQADAKPLQPAMKSSIVQPANDSPGHNVLSNNPEHEIVVLKAAQKAGFKGAELAQFMAQTKHESWDFARLKEKPQPGVKGYFAKKYDPKLAPKTAKILGNKKLGDGEKYKGRGFIQLTGRDNYRMAEKALGLPLLNNPDMAANPDVAAKIAIWYWNTRVKPHVQNFNDTRAVTQKINPAARGLESRHENFKDYMRII